MRDDVARRREHHVILRSASLRKASHPAIAIRAYQAFSGPHDPVVLVHEASRPYYGVAEEYCPNHIPEHVSLHPAWILREPTIIWYCPLCEKEFLERLRVPDQRKALEFAQYVLPIWGGGGVATKPRYEISLRGDTWTVSCFLVDGRKATIKFSKEKGSVISTKYTKPNSSNPYVRCQVWRADVV
jgi:hypothetical protein